MNRAFWSVIGALALATSPADAQELSGLVFSTGDGAPIEGAAVWLLDAEMVPVDSAVTNRFGHFTFSVVGLRARVADGQDGAPD